jgi:hypothetical protein
MEADQVPYQHGGADADGAHHPSGEADPPVIRIHFHTVTFVKTCKWPNELSDPAHEGVRLQPRRSRRVRCSAWLNEAAARRGKGCLPGLRKV